MDRKPKVLGMILVCSECKQRHDDCPCPGSIRKKPLEPAKDFPDQARARPAGNCECGNPLYYHALGSAKPKWCESCRKKRGSTNSKRGNKRELDGPVLTIRKMISELPSNLRPGGVSLHVACAAATLTGATGIPEQMGRHIIEALQVLVEQGETGEDIRRRLNPNPFGRLTAGQMRRGGLEDYLEEAETA